jgi:bifunctional DNA-binding transcriptional regulator/antitoxin component of YhaV-PrlF toxin-antitoxin module
MQCDHHCMAKVTGKLQITLPKALAGQCGIRVGDELELRPVGRSIQIDRRAAHDIDQLRRDRLAHFDRATARQRARERAARRPPARSRGWTRDELYGRGRSR